MLKTVIFFFIVALTCFSSNLFAQSYFDYELKSINFSGDNSFSQSDLKQIIESKESPMWFWSFLNSFTPFGDEPVFFDSSKISVDKLALTEYYRSNGFFKIAVTDSIVADTVNKTVNLYYQIMESNPFRYGKIKFYGLDKLTDFERSRIVDETIAIDSSKQYSEADLQNKINNIKRNLGNNGYVFAGYDSTIVSIDTVSIRTDVSMYFNTGKKYAISETIINKSGESEKQITDYLINEIADLKPGSLYDQSKIDRSELRLIKTELFNSIDINPVISDTTNYTIPIAINASIGSLNELSPEIKADNEFNSFNTGLGISYTRKNFFGDARKFSASTSLRLLDIPNFNFENIFRAGADRDSTYQGVLDFNINIGQPYLFGKPILTTTDLYLRFTTSYDRVSSSRTEESNYGIIQKFDFEMPSYTFITLLRPFINLDVIELSTVIDKTDSLNGNTKVEVVPNSFTPSIGIELGSSKTNDILFPTQGYFLFLTPELFNSRTTYTYRINQLSVLDTTYQSSGSAYFYRIQSGISHYYSLNKKRNTIFASKFRFGYTQAITSSDNPTLSTESLIPPNKTFYAGGSNSVRGWRARELTPTEKIKYLGAELDSTQIRGGTIWIEGSFELRKRIGEYFGYALFADYGNTWNGWKEVQITRYCSFIRNRNKSLHSNCTI